MASAGAALVALAAAAAGLALPVSALAQGVTWSGLPAVLPAAMPPLGWSAKLLAASVAALCAGLTAWACLFLLVGRRRLMVGPFPHAGRVGRAPVVRRADAHPDAPPRRPLFAEQDLGNPLPPPERPLPGDLDLPLAAFDPEAVPAEPLAAVRAVSSLARPAPLAPGERIATFALTPEPDTTEPPSLETLLGRLEDGARRRGGRRAPLPPTPGGTLEDALLSLQRTGRRA